MSKILEITASQEEAVVSRVLLLVHQVIDEKFPNLENSSRQFTKTVFSEEGESTAQHLVPTDVASDKEPPNIPPPPEQSRKTDNYRPQQITPPPSAAAVNKKSDTSPSRNFDPENLSNSTRLGTEMESLKPESPLSDWTTRITVALLIAGLVLLAYALLA
jgi:hypothetical protein